MATEVWRKQPATRLRPLQPPAVELDTPVEVTPGPLLWLTGSEGRAELGLGDRTLTMPAEAHAAARRGPAHRTGRSRSARSTSPSTTTRASSSAGASPPKG